MKTAKLSFKLGFLLMLSCARLYGQPNKVAVKGAIVNSPNLDKSFAYLVLGGSAETVKFHRSQIKNGQFEISLAQDYRDSLVFAFLFISPHSKMDNKVYRENIKNYKLFQFFLDTTQIGININYGAKWAAIKGGEVNEVKRKFDLVDSLYFKMGNQKEIEEQYKFSGDFLTDLNRYRTLAWIHLIKDNVSSPYSLIVASVLANMPSPRLTYRYKDEIREMLESFPAEIQATTKMKAIYASFEANLKRNDSKAGLPFPSITLMNDKLTSVAFKDIYGTKEYVLLDFWATWCGPCINQQPTIKKLAEKFRDGNVQIVGISVDQKISLWSSFLKKKPFNYPQYRFDPSDKDLLTAIGALKIPTYTLVEKSTGKVIEYDISISALEKTLEKYR